MWLLLSLRYCTYLRGQHGVTPYPRSHLQEGRHRMRGGQAVLFLRTRGSSSSTCTPIPLAKTKSCPQPAAREAEKCGPHPGGHTHIKILICSGQGVLPTQRKKRRVEGGRSSVGLLGLVCLIAQAHRTFLRNPQPSPLDTRVAASKGRRILTPKADIMV